jgi:LacI family transcriptional regulator
MASIKDVAKAAAVSISTVSYAINDDPRIPEITASRIKKIAAEIGYFPSAAARNLKKRSTHTVLVAISDFGGPVYHELLDGIHRQLMQDGYTMIVSTGQSSENLLKERSADAAIISDIHLSSEMLLRNAKNFGPIIVLDRALEGDSIRHLTIDNAKAMEELTELVLAKGSTKLAFVNGVVDTFDNQTRREGFLSALHRHKLEPFAEYIGNFTKPSGERLITELLATKMPLPEVFVCANDEMAIGVMDRLKQEGFAIPKDVKVTGFDDIELASYVQPRLSTVQIDHRGWGQMAARLAILMLKSEAVPNAPQRGILRIRDSF